MLAHKFFEVGAPISIEAMLWWFVHPVPGWHRLRQVFRQEVQEPGDGVSTQEIARLKPEAHTKEGRIIAATERRKPLNATSQRHRSRLRIFDDTMTGSRNLL